MSKRADQEPGFWCAYKEPESEVSRLVQMPSYMIDGYSLSDAYIRDWRKRVELERAK